MGPIIRNVNEFIKNFSDAKHKFCHECCAGFSKLNVHTPEGWANTQKLGVCEDCYEEQVTRSSEDDDV